MFLPHCVFPSTECVTNLHGLVHLEEAASLIILDNIVEVRTQQSRPVDPSLSK